MDTSSINQKKQIKKKQQKKRLQVEINKKTTYNLQEIDYKMGLTKKAKQPFIAK